MQNTAKHAATNLTTKLLSEGKSWRILSDFNNSTIDIDISESIKVRGSRIREFDTDSVLINTCGGKGLNPGNDREAIEPGTDREGLGPGIYKLSQYDHLRAPMLNALNSALRSSDRAPAQAFSNSIRLTTRIYSYIFRQGFTHLAELKREDINQLSAEVSELGWWDLLQYQKALLQEAKNILKDSERLFHIATKRDGRWVFSPEALSFKIGLPINGNDIPNWFRTATVTKEIPPLESFDRPEKAGPSRGEHQSTLTAINRLASLGEGFDRIRFNPFRRFGGELSAGDKRRANTLKSHLSASSGHQAEVAEAAPQNSSQQRPAATTQQNDELSPLEALGLEVDALTVEENLQQNAEAPSQHATPNMPLSVAVAGFKEALRWQYDYKAAILEVLGILRDSLETEITNGRVLPRPFTEKVVNQVNGILAAAGVPIQVNRASRFGDDPDNDNTAAALINTTLFALFFNIATNLGRRPAEIHGGGNSKKSYGLYRGCCVRVSDKIPFYRIETYIQKSIGDYATSWCNQLVADAVSFLEEIFQIARPLFTSQLPAEANLEVARTEKLFGFPHFTERGFKSERPIFDARQASNIFFRLAGIDPKMFFGRQMPFRRTFMTLYVHRYDCPELLALQQYMRDFSIESLLAYYRDKANCLPEDSIQAHFDKFEREALNIASMLQEARKNYLIEILTDLLSGQRRFGGAFPRVVHALLKRLSLPENFKDAPLSEKAEWVADELEQRGYRMVEGNTPCMAGSAGKTKENSNCFDGEHLRVDQASPSMCSGCVHAIPTENNLSIYEEEMESAMKTANDKRLPLALRKEAQALIETLKQVIASEKELAEGTRVRFQNFANTWNTIREELKT
ncbi:hypothetical protein VOM14_16190 [Paraburkholderia sp. MPAMCS5]|uniref:hypothetical protein n=1 Tax=Paraburkholderia sp. MPAMCS5 TaxID=3112563 RepID=UPI002E191E73|nr:hypothetical protein [Paraburkholderia sp. MPAMCS5]